MSLFQQWERFDRYNVWANQTWKVLRNPLSEGLIMSPVMAENVYALWTVLLLIHQTLNTPYPTNYPVIAL